MVVRAGNESSQDNIGLVAAGVAFYAFLALVPLLGAIVLTYGIVADPHAVLSNVKSLTSLMPQDAAKLIGQQLMSVVHTSGSKKGIGLVIAIAVALFGARNAAGSIITALNIAYEEKERRSLLKMNLLALGITAGAVAMAVVALIAIAALGYLQKLLPHLPGFVATIGKIVSYIVLVLGGAAAAASLYRYGPDRRDAKWEWITPGSIFAAVAWVLLTLGFGFYVAHFGNYNKTYGSLATVVILVTWMYLSAYVLLFGAELNSELEQQRTKDTTAEARRPMGERGAWSANHIASGDQPTKPHGEAVSPLHEDSPRQPEPVQREPSTVNVYVASRLTNRTAAVAGMRSVGMVSAILSTVGLSLLRKRGKAAAGAALVAAAAGLSLLKRRD